MDILYRCSKDKTEWSDECLAIVVIDCERMSLSVECSLEHDIACSITGINASTSYHCLVVTQINISNHFGICRWIRSAVDNIGESFPVCNGSNKIISVFILSHRSKYLWQRITSAWILRPSIAKCGSCSTVREFCFCGLSALYVSPRSFIITVVNSIRISLYSNPDKGSCAS